MGEKLQRAPHQRLGAAAARRGERLAQRAVCFGGVVAQSLERLEGRFRGAVGRPPPPPPPPPPPQLAPPVRQVKREAPSGLLAKAAYRPQKPAVPLLPAPHPPCATHRGHKP